MPAILPAAAAAIAAAAPAAATAAAASAATSTLAAAAVAGIKSVLINLAVSAAMSVLNPQVGQAGRPVDWTLDPDGPLPFAAGRVGAAGAIVHKATFGPDLMYYGLVSVLSGAGPIKSFQSFRADEETVTFDAAGMAISSQWSNEMWMKTQPGFQPTLTAMTTPTGLKNNVLLPNWTSSSLLNGKAAYLKIMGENSKRTAYPNGETKPLWVIEGLFGWDPRQDSSYPGGAGDCRLNDPSTWVYLENPILWALKWALGLWEGPTGRGAPQVDYQVGGIGAKVEGIDVAAFVSAANVSDANGWTVAAYPTTDDDKAQVLDAFLQAGGAVYAQQAGRISCIQRAAPRTSIVTISAADTAGPLEIDTAASRINRINTLRPRFWSEANRWQMTAITEVTAESYQTEDGGKRTRGVDFPYVPNPVQCAQLAALQIAHTREGIAGVIPLKPHLQRITPGDAFTITEAGFVLNGLKCLCLNTEYDPATGVHRVTFVSETDAKYPFALGQSPDAPESPTLTPVDPTLVAPPGAGDWVITPRPPGPGGGVPGFDLAGLVANATAFRVLVEVGPSNVGPWTPAYDGPPTTERVSITVEANSTYWVAVSYFNRAGNQSSRTVYGPFTAGPVVAGDADGLGGRSAAELLAFFREVAGTQEETDRAAEALIASALDDFGRVRREATERGVAIAEVRNEVETVVTETSASITSLTSQVVALDDAVAGVQTEVTTVVSDLAAETSTRETQVSALGASVAAVESTVSTVASDLAAEVTAREALAASTTSGLASVSSTLTAVSNQQTVQAGQITTAQSTANGASSSAALALSALNGNEAYIALIVDVAGRLTGQRINGSTGDIAFLSESVSFLSSSSGARTEYADGIWTSYSADNTVRSMWGKPFGGSEGLVWWTGPNSTPAGSESKAGAYVYVAMTAPRFGGSDVPTGGGGGGGAAFQRVFPAGGILSGTDWVTLGALTFPSRPAGGWWELNATGFFGTTSGGAVTLEYELLENSTSRGSGSTSADGTGVSIPIFANYEGNQAGGAGSYTITLRARLTSGSSLNITEGELTARYFPPS